MARKRRNNNYTYKPGERAPESRIYTCGRCNNPTAMLQGEIFARCEVCYEKNKNKPQSWKQTSKEILVRERNVKKEFQKKRSASQKISDSITSFCGTLQFVYIHVAWFAIWLIWNTGPATFDPFPFGLLTLIVSLEAIVLATFILISQNRQGEMADMRSELDYQVDLQSGKATEELLSLVRDLHKRTKKRR